MSPVVRKLPVLIVNPHNRCNCRCVMCDIWKRDTVEQITPARFSAQLASMERLGVEWVVFSGGEPLMHGDLLAFCAELRSRGIRVSLLSSGLLLGRYADQIVRHVDDVIVSLDGPPEVHDEIRRVVNGFNLLAAGVARLGEARAGFQVSARCTVQRRNCRSLRPTRETARSLGLRSVSFLAADVHSEAFNRAPDFQMVAGADTIAVGTGDLPALSAEIEGLIATGECGGFILESPSKLRRIVHHFQCYLGMAEPVAPMCNAPWTSAVLEADGTVRPCFFHPPFGELSDTRDLYDVVNGEAAVAFRESLDVADNAVFPALRLFVELEGGGLGGYFFRLNVPQSTA